MTSDQIIFNNYSFVLGSVYCPQLQKQHLETHSTTTNRQQSAAAQSYSPHKQCHNTIAHSELVLYKINKTRGYCTN